MKNDKLVILTAAVLGICQIASADALLIDAYSSQNATAIANYVNAGVTEDLTGAAGGTIAANGAVYNMTGGMTASVVGSGSYNGGAFANGMLTDYFNVNSGAAGQFASSTVSLGGFGSELTTDGYQSEIYGDMEGNTFTLLANQEYKLYLFGMGDADGQDTTFTFDGVSKTTSGVLAGAEDSHYVTYELTTGADTSAFTLDFSYSNNTVQYGAFNGLALVAVPEPATLGLVAAFGGGILFIRKRFMI